MDAYVIVKIIHIAIAIVALGTSAGMGVLTEWYGDDPRHGAFLLRSVQRIERLVVWPGYVLMPVTGLWMVFLAWPLMAWIQAALVLWTAGAVLLGGYGWLLRRQILLAESDGPSTPRYRRIALAGKVVGGASGIVVLSIVYVMVAKPAW